MRSFIPRPTWLIADDYCDGERLDGIGWLLHELLRVSKSDIKRNRRLVMCAERELCDALEVTRNQLMKFTAKMDSLDPESRLAYFEEWCESHGIYMKWN